HVKTLGSQKLRVLLTHRKLLESKAIAIENDLRATLRNFGLKVGVIGTVKFETRIRELVANLPDLAALVESLLIVRQVVREQLGILHRRVLAIVRDDDVCRRLMTIASELSHGSQSISTRAASRHRMVANGFRCRFVASAIVSAYDRPGGCFVGLKVFSAPGYHSVPRMDSIARSVGISQSSQAYARLRATGQGGIVPVGLGIDHFALVVCHGVPSSCCSSDLCTSRTLQLAEGARSYCVSRRPDHRSIALQGQGSISAPGNSRHCNLHEPAECG